MADNTVRSRFVRQVLENEGRLLLSRQETAITSLTKSGSGHLLGERSVTVSGGEDLDGKLTFTHVAYERFLDMRKKGRKRRRIHNRFVWSAYASIAERLMYGLTEDVAAQIREELPK